MPLSTTKSDTTITSTTAPKPARYLRLAKDTRYPPGWDSSQDTWGLLEPTPPDVRAPVRPTTWWRGYVTVAAAFLVVFGPAVVTILSDGIGAGRSAPTWDELPAAAIEFWLSSARTLAIAILVFLYVVWRRRSTEHHLRARDLGLAPPWSRPSDPTQRARRRQQAVEVFLAVFVAYALASAILAACAALWPDHVALLQRDSLDTATRLHIWAAPVLVLTAVYEELIVVGLVVTVLAAARRPTAEILLVAALTKVSYHLYYGWPVLLALGPAAAFIAWLYLRTGRLTPVILAHAAYNVTGLVISQLALYLEHSA